MENYQERLGGDDSTERNKIWRYNKEYTASDQLKRTDTEL